MIRNSYHAVIHHIEWHGCNWRYFSHFVTVCLNAVRLGTLPGLSPWNSSELSLMTSNMTLCKMNTQKTYKTSSLHHLPIIITLVGGAIILCGLVWSCVVLKPQPAWTRLSPAVTVVRGRCWSNRQTLHFSGSFPLSIALIYTDSFISFLSLPLSDRQPGNNDHWAQISVISHKTNLHYLWTLHGLLQVKNI